MKGKKIIGDDVIRAGSDVWVNLRGIVSGGGNAVSLKFKLPRGTSQASFEDLLMVKISLMQASIQVLQDQGLQNQHPTIEIGSKRLNSTAGLPVWTKINFVQTELLTKVTYI